MALSIFKLWGLFIGPKVSEILKRETCSINYCGMNFPKFPLVNGATFSG